MLAIFYFGGRVRQTSCFKHLHDEAGVTAPRLTAQTRLVEVYGELASLQEYFMGHQILVSESDLILVIRFSWFLFLLFTVIFFVRTILDAFGDTRSQFGKLLSQTELG